MTRQRKIIIGAAVAVAAFFLFSGRNANASERPAPDIDGLNNNNAGKQEPGGIFSALLGQLTAPKFTPAASGGNVDNVGDDNANAMFDKTPDFGGSGPKLSGPAPTNNFARTQPNAPTIAGGSPVNPNLADFKSISILDEGRNRANLSRFR